MVDLFDFEFEMYDINKEEIKSLIYDEIMLYHEISAQKNYIN